MGVHIHRLSNINSEAKRAICRHCGDVPIGRKGGGWRCIVGIREQKGPHRYTGRIAEASGLCEICKEKATQIDHDHQTGKFRGFLCFRCNAGIGLLSEKVHILKKAIWYLKKTTPTVS